MTTDHAMSSAAAAIEQDRLTALHAYDVLDTPPEEGFDRVTRLVSRIFSVPISTVTLIDGHRQWFKSRQGLSGCETARDVAICDYTIREEAVLVVPDTHADPRFASNPLVVGPPFVRFYAGIPLRTPSGQAIGTLCAADTQPREFGPQDVATLRDLAQIVKNELELRMLASTDSLTGAMSRSAFRAEAMRACDLARRHGHALSCVMLDLDHFKAINDHQGHAMGDLVLAETIALCRRLLRRTDLVGRLGGEEFAFLLPHTNLEAAKVTAEKLRAGIASQRILCGSGLLPVSASLGIAVWEPATTDLDELLQNADAALYEAKSQGRNRWVARRPVVAAAAQVAPRLGGPSKRRVLKAGRITFNNGRSTIDCTVRALSEAEADLSVISTADIPEVFKLRIEADDLSRLCRVSRKQDQLIAVAFE